MLDLAIDLDGLRAAADRLLAVAELISVAGPVDPDAAELTGHAALAGRVDEFAGAWELSRRRLVDALGSAAAGLSAVVAAFDGVDWALAAGAVS